jgi:hypothetical protein
VFVSDLIPAELRRVIEFLNERMSPTEVVGVEIKQYAGHGGLKTLVPGVVGQTEQARIQKIGAARSPGIDVSWDYYEARLQSDQLVIARALFERIQKAVTDRDLGWVPKLRPGYFGFQRPGGYYCAGDSFTANARPTSGSSCRFRPTSCGVLAATSQTFTRNWSPAGDAANKQWRWAIPALDAVPDVAPAIELTSRYQPLTGPMLIPAS